MSPLRLRVREARELRGLSQSALAERVGVRRATISDIERGVTGWTGEMLERLADALDVDAAWLIKRTRK